MDKYRGPSQGGDSLNEDSQQLRLTHDEWVILTARKSDYQDFYREVLSYLSLSDIRKRLHGDSF